MSLIVPVILCGGSGTRLWPLSRESHPKQFLSLLSERSSFEQTLQMVARPELFAPPVVLSNRDYRFLVAEQLQAVDIAGEIVLEPVRRGSGFAAAVAAEMASRRTPETVVALLAADHAISDRDCFVALCQRAAEIAAQGHIVALGVKPDHAATRYGYIRPGEPTSGGALVVDGFTEKPDAPQAEELLAAGCLWNSENLVFRADVMRSEIEAFEPKLADAARAAVDGARLDLDFIVLDQEAFERAPNKSIGCAVMERTTKGVVLPANVGWSDVGSWAAVRERSAPDERGNVLRGDGVIMDGRNVYVRSDGGLTAG